MDSDEEIKKRKEKILSFFKNSQFWVFILLVIAIILGVYIRSLPMTDHNGRPGLFDVTTNTWTLGPDLDPWLFLRNAKTIVETGSLSEIDYMRNVPLGFDNSIEVPLLPYMIAWTYYVLKWIGIDKGVEFAGVIFPVIMFVLTIISFFLFVREIFIRKSKKSILNANLIAIISTFFMIVIPVFLSRTIAGIPEKESAAFFFMFLTFYLFLKAWKSSPKKSIIYASLSGISTGIMGLIWGGVIYVFISIALASLIAFMLEKLKKKQFLAYFLWIFFSFLILMYFSPKRYDFSEMFTSLSSGLAFLTLFIIITHYLVWNTRLYNFLMIKESRLPKTILSFIIAIILLIILSIIFLGPSFIIEKIRAIHQTIFKPVIGRWNITVAENRQPNFQEWSQNFGPYIKGIPLFFWLFFIGSIILFRKMLIKLAKKDLWILTFLYVLFFAGIVFSRYSGSSVFNGENFISKLFYYLTAVLFIASFLYYYNQYRKNSDGVFKKIKFSYLLLFSLFILTLFTVRGAVRLIMVLGPIAPIFVGFLIVESVNKYLKSKEIMKVIWGFFTILVLISSIYSFFIFYKSVEAQGYSFVPSSYNIQWQKAMEWTRENTPKNAVFGHWWDYGYWVQSIGDRATILDGGNAITYWNYLMGRHILTGNNQDDALEFLYNHNATHLLIDSTDIGKYGAFSSIGSDKNFDRYSFMGIFLLDENQIQETKNQTILVYTGGISLDEDLFINENLIPANSAAVGAIVIPTKNNEYQQPHIIIVYQGQQYNVKLRYLYLKDNIIDFKEGIEAAGYIFPKIDLQNGGAKINEVGASMYISPRLFRGMLSHVYIMNDPLNKFQNFKPVHTEPDLVVSQLRSQGVSSPEIVYFQGFRGPIKIWEIKYTGKEKIKREYLDTDETKYLDWLL